MKTIEVVKKETTFLIEVSEDELLVLRSAVGQLSTNQVISYDTRLKGKSHVSSGVYKHLDDLVREYI